MCQLLPPLCVLQGTPAWDPLRPLARQGVVHQKETSVWGPGACILHTRVSGCTALSSCMWQGLAPEQHGGGGPCAAEPGLGPRPGPLFQEDGRMGGGGQARCRPDFADRTLCIGTHPPLPKPSGPAPPHSPSLSKKACSLSLLWETPPHPPTSAASLRCVWASTGPFLLSPTHATLKL